jgi:ribose-phosphate pyrophosphokinase
MSLAVFTGSANQPLADAVATRLGVEAGRPILKRFLDTELNVQIHHSVRGDDVYLIQPTGPPVDENLMELLFIADACRRAGAARVTAVIPYFGYARQDRRASGREAVGGRIVADLIKSPGIERVVAIDLHTTSLEGFFATALEHLTAISVLAQAVMPHLSPDSVVLSPDLGGVKLAEHYATILQRPLAVVHKIRISGEEVQARGIVGEVRGRPAVVVDDMISTGGTIEAAVQAFLAQGGAPEIVVVASHGLLVGPAGERLRALPIKALFVTDSVVVPTNLSFPIQLVSIAPLLAEAITRLHNNHSMSDLIVHR